MKPILICSLAFIALQVVLGGALPTATTEPPKDIIYDFLRVKFSEYKSSVALTITSAYSKLFQSSMEFLESPKGAELIDSETLADLKKDWLHFQTSFEIFKKDKYNCRVLKELIGLINHLRPLIRDHLLHDPEQLAYWAEEDNMGTNLRDPITKKSNTEVSMLLPQIIVKYKATLSEAERKEFEQILLSHANIYAALYSIYEPMLTTAHGPFDDGYCNDTKNIARYLKRLSYDCLEGKITVCTVDSLMK